MKRPPAAAVLAASSLFFGTMALVAKKTELPGSEVAFVRFLVGLAGVALAATRVRMRAVNRRGLFLRGLFGGGAVLCFFTAIEHLPVGLATLLNYTSPIFTVLLAAIFLGERIGAAGLFALCVTTVGVGLVVQGDIATFHLGAWVLVGILSSLFSGAAVTTIREVRRTDGSWEIFGAFCGVGALVTGGPSAHAWVWPSAHGWALMLLVGVLALVGQMLMTWSLRYLKAGIAGILMQLTPVCAMLLGWLLLGERMRGLALIGATITVAGVAFGAQREAAVEPPPGPR